MKEQFRPKKQVGVIGINLGEKGVWTADKQDIVEKIIDIAEDFERQGYTMTLRQLYYQLVGKDWIPNHDKVYKKLSSLKDEVVYTGEVDWGTFEDRGRVPKVPHFENSVKDALEGAARYYRLARQTGQSNHVEVWTEKDAISSILWNITYNMGVTLVVNKGYTSSTAIYGAYDRFMDALRKKGKTVTILYFGDHDPSGLDMIRDIRDRLMFMFLEGEQKEDMRHVISEWCDELDEDGEESFTDICWSYINDPDCRTKTKGDDETYFDGIKAFFKRHFKVVPIGLTMEQIEEYNLPHNPAKITDPRAKAYIEKFGQVSWEVDALKPKVIEQIVEGGIKEHTDMDVYRAIVEKEANDKAKIKSIVENL